MRILQVSILLAALGLAVYWPHKNAEFILDDYYTVAGNPLIQNPVLYPKIWVSRLFDADPSARYIKHGYWRPVLESSWIMDYRLFGLKPCGFQWTNLIIHLLNSLLVFILLARLFDEGLGFKASLLFCVLPSQEWVVRYITGRGDELSVLWALAAMVCLVNAFKSGLPRWFLPALIFWALACMTREVALSYILFAFLLEEAYLKPQNINRFCAYWVLIGLLPLALIWSIVPKQGNILIWHVFYLASVGVCLWMAKFRFRWVLALLVLFATLSFTQGRYWTSEETLLRHTRSLEYWPGTVTHQQLLMKYDEDVPAIEVRESAARDPLIKAMWMRRLGIISFFHGNLMAAEGFYAQALTQDPKDVESLDALAVIAHYRNDEDLGFKYLKRSLEINPLYPNTLRTLGIYFFIHGDLPRARLFLSRCLFFDPTNAQARSLLALAKGSN